MVPYRIMLGIIWKNGYLLIIYDCVTTHAREKLTAKVENVVNQKLERLQQLKSSSGYELKTADGN